MLFQQGVDYGRYDLSCDVYSLAITLAEALPAPPESGIGNELSVQRPYSSKYNAVGNEVPRFIREEIIAKVSY